MIIGGAPCNKGFRQAVEADHYTNDSGEGIRNFLGIYGAEDPIPVYTGRDLW